MSEFTAQLLLVGAVLLTGFTGPAIALAFLIQRRNRARQRRKSPINREMLRTPGHTLREQLEALQTDLDWHLTILIAMPLMVLALALAQGHLLGLDRVLRVTPIYVVFVAAFLIWMTTKLWKVGRRLDALRAGYDAELAIGQELDRLMRQGGWVFHDVPCEGFNIDHLVVAQQGVYAVETKGYTKPVSGKDARADATVTFDGTLLTFPTWHTREPLEQAERQAAWAAKWLTSAIGNPVRVQPVLALPGWWVQRNGRGAVWVFSGRELPQLLDQRGSQPLTPQQVQQVAHQVEQACRNVTPTLKRIGRAASTFDDSSRG